MDPSRDAAKAERINRIKKNLGKKKLMNDVYEKAAPKWSFIFLIMKQLFDSDS